MNNNQILRQPSQLCNIVKALVTINDISKAHLKV